MRKKTSSGLVAFAAAIMVSAAMPRNTAGSGCTTARLSSHGSRGRTQVMALGETPFCRSQTHVSVAVLPAPTMTYLSGACWMRTSSLTATTRAPSSTTNGGGVSSGMSGDRYRASTTREPGAKNRVPLSIDTNRRPPRYSVRPWKLHTARCTHAFEHAGVILGDFRRTRPFVKPAFGSVGPNPAAAEKRRSHAVERRCLMKSHEPVCVEPMTAGAMAAIENRHRRVRRGGERVDEGHAHRAGPDHEVVDVDGLIHGLIRAVAALRVNGPISAAWVGRQEVEPLSLRPRC